MKCLLVYVILFAATNSFAQNILADPSFENGNTWSYYKTIDEYNGYYYGGVGEEFPQDGNNYLGIRFYHVDTAYYGEWHEYIFQSVNGLLDADSTYKLSLWYSVGDFCTRTTNDLGIGFVNYNIFAYPNAQLMLPAHPPAVKLATNYYPTNVDGYEKLEGYYTATGDEEFIVIGCFKVNATLDTIGISSTYIYNQGDLYFFIDNTNVSKCIDYPEVNLESEILLCEPGNVTLDAFYPGASYEWSTGDTSSQITTFIDESEYISVSLSKNGCTFSDSTFIRIFIDSEQEVDHVFCDKTDLPITKTIGLNDDETILWDDGSTNPIRSFNESGHYYYTKTIGSCSFSDTFDIVVFEESVLPYPNPGVDEINFTYSQSVFVVSVVSSEGKTVLNHPLNNDELDKFIGELAPGIYLIQIEEGECRNLVKYEKISLK